MINKCKKIVKMEAQRTDPFFKEKCICINKNIYFFSNRQKYLKIIFNSLIRYLNVLIYLD
jgi:hypothetical protein